MVIDLEKLLQEVTEADKHYPGVGSRIFVDKDAFIVLDKHKEEDKVTNAHIGSTNRGIGPCYKDKVGRSGVRIGDLLSMKANKDNCDDYGNLISILYNLVGFDVHFTNVMTMEEEFKKSRILFEGAQGVLLDINHGIYPYVSSSDCCVSGIVSSGFGFVKVDKVYGVAKAYTTKVGEGPFPTEYHGEEAEELRKRGNEYGATTGRPRRVGCLDLPALRYACKKGGITHLIVTKFDILDGAPKVKVCKAYDYQPVCSSDFFDAKPIYDEISGWENAKTPGALELFLDLVEHATGLEIDYISCGTSDADILSV
jgi:adenylosuccinate synthase